MLDCGGAIVAWRVASMFACMQLPFFTTIVATLAMYAGESWGVHPHPAAQRRMTAQKHSKFLRQLIRVSPSTDTYELVQQSTSQSLATCPCNKGGCRLAFALGMRCVGSLAGACGRPVP